MAHLKRLMQCDNEKKPVLMALHYEKDTVFKVGGLYEKRPGRGLGFCGRGDIDHFSRQSRQRLRLYLRNIASGMKVCATLTYPAAFPLDGRVSKRHLNNFLQFLRRRHIKYLWVEEFQRRGAPHFHFLLSAPIEKDLLAKTWARIVGSGDYLHERSGTSIEWIRNHDAVGNYFYDKYITKNEQKHVPSFFLNVGRFWGMTRGLIVCRAVSYATDVETIGRLIRPVRRWYKKKMQEFGYNWSWWGKGFVCWDYSLVSSKLSFV